MKHPKIAIVGGGLAGLTAAIHLGLAGKNVVLFEKESYPHHKVCGEYLSREILPYLERLNVPFQEIKPVDITKLFYSSNSGRTIKSLLPLGGVGISRYALDNMLYLKALEVGVEVIKDTVTTVEFRNDKFLINGTANPTRDFDLVLGAFGKRSLLDKKLERDFIQKKTGWLAVKGHYRIKNYPWDTVSLHNFEGGYCGLSRTETGAVNVCYLATYNSFKKYKNPEDYKTEVLSKNIHLKNFFEQASPEFSQDLTIAQISFDQKSQISNHLLMMGDAAGLIHPLCGNGMAMAIHSAKIASECVLKFITEGSNNRDKLEKDYSYRWNKEFQKRFKAGRILQSILLNRRLAEISQSTLNIFPSLLPHIIKRTHGKQVL